MAQQIVRIAQNNACPRSDVAKFLGIVIYPSSTKKRLMFELAVEHLIQHGRHCEVPVSPRGSEAVTPAIFMLKPAHRNKILDRAIDKILSNGLLAAEMAADLFVQEALTSFETNTVVRLINEVRGEISRVDSEPIQNIKITASTPIKSYDPLTDQNVEKYEPVSVNNAAERLAQSLNETQSSDLGYRGGSWDRSAVISRIWSPNRPILHLAFALRGLLLARHGKNVFSLDDLLTFDWVKSTIKQAEYLRRDIANSNRFRWSLEEMIKVEYVASPEST